MDTKFQVYNKDTLLADVEVVNGKVSVKRYALIPGIQPFGCSDLKVTLKI